MPGIRIDLVTREFSGCSILGECCTRTAQETTLVRSRGLVRQTHRACADAFDLKRGEELAGDLIYGNGEDAFETQWV